MLGFDMETDVGSWTPFYEGLEKGTPKILKLLDKEKCEATFFFTGEAAQKFPDVVKQVISHGHEVGCHSLYHETVGEELFAIPGMKPLLPEEIPLRLRLATELVSKALGEKPVSFRCPRLFGSTSVVNVLDKMGYVTDCSYPLYFYEKQLVPYHPAPHNWTEKGNLKILEIPNFADLTMVSKDPYGRDRDQWPLYRTKSTDELMIHINNFIGLLEDKNLPCVVCFYFHPWEFVKLKKSFHFGEGSIAPDEFLVKNCGEYALQEFSKLIDRLKEIGAVFYTARRLANEWDGIDMNERYWKNVKKKV